MVTTKFCFSCQSHRAVEGGALRGTRWRCRTCLAPVAPRCSEEQRLKEGARKAEGYRRNADFFSKFVA